jgi:CheY-like chemotaxis protein
MRRKVLICDNEEILRGLVRASLDRDDYELAEAVDGDDALEQARALEPDLILLDMMMPGRSGLDVVRELRADERLADVPVVMLTARAQAGDVAAAEAAGTDHFVAKPFSPAALAELVRSILERRR